MAQIIVCCAQKGGCAKTVTVHNLSYALSRMGKRVLAVDFDAQANLTTCFGFSDPDEIPVNIARYGVDFDVYYGSHAEASAHGHQTWEAYYAGGNGTEIQVTTTENVRICNVTLTSQSLQNLIGSRMDSEQQELYSVYLSTRGNRQFLGSPFNANWYGNVSSYYGYRIHPISGNLQIHRGLDIAAPQGTEILAVHDGTVTTAAYESSYGNYIVLENDDAYKTKYAHCSSLKVSQGQEVKKGDVIALVGSTGNSTGPHLHIEFLYQDEYLNPYVGIYVGNGQMIHAGDPIQYASINTAYWQNHFFAFGRVGYRCSSRDCTFCLWKDSAFLNGLKKPITKKMAIDFLQSGRVHAKGLYSTRTGKSFDADILLTETTDKRGKRISSYKLEFPSQKRQP